jgi:hypothetical protein
LAAFLLDFYDQQSPLNMLDYLKLTSLRCDQLSPVAGGTAENADKAIGYALNAC